MTVGTNGSDNNYYWNVVALSFSRFESKTSPSAYKPTTDRLHGYPDGFDTRGLLDGQSNINSPPAGRASDEVWGVCGISFAGSPKFYEPISSE